MSDVSIISSTDFIVSVETVDDDDGDGEGEIHVCTLTSRLFVGGVANNVESKVYKWNKGLNDEFLILICQIMKRFKGTTPPSRVSRERF